MTTLTKEEITKVQTGIRPMPMKDIYIAMDTYAKQECIEFLKWAGENVWIGNSWHHIDDKDGNKPLSETELYELYIQSKK